MSSVTQSGPIHLGLDVHKDSISVAVLPSGQESAGVDKIFHDEPSVRRLIARFPDPGRLRACYEAGPTGYEQCSVAVVLEVMPGAGGPFLMAAHVRTVNVPEADRRELERRARDKGAPARGVGRARVVLLAADGGPGQQIATLVGCGGGTGVTWRGRYA